MDLRPATDVRLPAGWQSAGARVDDVLLTGPRSDGDSIRAVSRVRNAYTVALERSAEAFRAAPKGANGKGERGDLVPGPRLRINESEPIGMAKNN